MMTIGALLAFSGFFSGYNSSRKAVLTGNSWLELWLRSNPLQAKALGVLLLAAALFVLLTQFGIGAGTFVFFTLLMLFGSLIILLAPLKVVTLKTTAITFAVAISIEFLNFV